MRASFTFGAPAFPRLAFWQREVTVPVRGLFEQERLAAFPKQDRLFASHMIRRLSGVEFCCAGQRLSQARHPNIVRCHEVAAASACLTQSGCLARVVPSAVSQVGHQLCNPCASLVFSLGPLASGFCLPPRPHPPKKPNGMIRFPRRNYQLSAGVSPGFISWCLRNGSSFQGPTINGFSPGFISWCELDVAHPQ